MSDTTQPEIQQPQEQQINEEEKPKEEQSEQKEQEEEEVRKEWEGITEYEIEENPDSNFKDMWNNNIIVEFAKALKLNSDLTRISFPVCILQPRSMIEKFTDYFIHSNIISEAANTESQLDRLLLLTKWYISGFAHAMKFVRKPYNPIIGEITRTCWKESDDSVTYYVSEQVSHHPPISAYYITNKTQGWEVQGSIDFKVSFYGLSAWAYLVGVNTVKLYKYNEEWTFQFPGTKASGFIVGPFVMELGGQIVISSKSSKYSSSLDFKTNGLFSWNNMYLMIGKVLEDKKQLYELKGRYNDKIMKKDMINKSAKEEVFYDTANPPQPIPQRYRVCDKCLDARESRVVWKKLTEAIHQENQTLAADEKNNVEEWQRQERREREEKQEVYEIRLFNKQENGQWKYKYAEETIIDPNTQKVVEEKGQLKIIPK